MSSTIIDGCDVSPPEAGRLLPPRTFFFSGKAAPAYHFAKLIIKFINNLGATLDSDPMMKGRLKVFFVPDYNVSIAERLIPASDVSEQISTAGYEASGTGNMKLMMNGALTIGTRDGATIEMAAAAGEENFFLFGLSAKEVAESRGRYNPRWHYDHDPEMRAALDLIAGDHFSPNEPGVFAPIIDVLLHKGDYYLHLADLKSYSEAHTRLGELYANQEQWSGKAVLNIAACRTFSSDRTIVEYARDIWHAEPCPVDEAGTSGTPSLTTITVIGVRSRLRSRVRRATCRKNALKSVRVSRAGNH